jgi:hypothetical protein
MDPFGGSRVRDHHDLDLARDQLVHEVGDPREAPFGESLLDHEVLTFHPAEIAQPMPEGPPKSA